jgi:AmmeMemoRadiSam system protein B
MKRVARFAGLWYPDDPQELSSLVEPRNGRKDGGRYRFAVLPHAGLYYSGELIASFFSVLAEDVEHVVILAPSHYHFLQPGTLYTSGFTESETPLGSVPTVPLSLPGSVLDDRAVADEHAVEMFLPFIAARGGLSVSYVLVGQLLGADDVLKLAERLSPLVGERTAVIASSDFTHYGRRFNYMPYGSCAVEKVVQNDLDCAELLAKGNIKDIVSTYAAGTICGIAPAMVTSRLAYAQGLTGHVDGHSTSLDKGGGRGDDFVSYVTVFWR